MTPNGYNTAIRALFDAWELRHDRTAAVPIDHTQGFIRDGVVYPAEWSAQPVRPLYLLKEAYGEGRWDLAADHLRRTHRASLMWRRVSAWTYGLLGTTAQTIAPYGGWGDIEHYGNHYLLRSAVVNVKKSGGRSHSDMDDILAYARFDRDLLYRELELCDPTVIVCGYTASVLDILFRTEVRRDRNELLTYHVPLNGHDVLVLDYWHPANHYPDLMNYYGLIGAYQQALRTAQGL